MLGRTYDDQICSIARTLEVTGERWSMLIIRDAAFAGVTRFGDFRHNLGIATNILASRLDAFVEAGIMQRQPSPEQAGQHEYVLTEKGRDLVPALIALTEWGDRWSAPAGPPILYRHASCGEPVELRIACATCGTIAAEEVSVRPGPGMPAEYLAARRPARRR